MLIHKEFTNGVQTVIPFALMKMICLRQLFLCQVGKNPTMIMKYLAKLTSEGKVVRLKGRKTGHWEITGKNNEA